MRISESRRSRSRNVARLGLDVGNRKGHRGLTEMPLISAVANRPKRASCRYRPRKQVAEPVFRGIEQARGFLQTPLRGRDQAHGERAMICTAHDLRNLAQAESWDHRFVFSNSGIAPPHRLRAPLPSRAPGYTSGEWSTCPRTWLSRQRAVSSRLLPEAALRSWPRFSRGAHGPANAAPGRTCRPTHYPWLPDR